MTGLFGVLRREALLEWRRPGRWSSLVFFSAAVVLLVAFASPSEAALREQAGGTFWVAILLASTRAVDQAWQVDLENGALEALVLWPVEPAVLFYAKVLALTATLTTVALATGPLILGMYDAPLRGDVGTLLLLLVTGCAGLAAPATLLGAMTAQARGASVLLPLLLFPLVVPALLAAAKGTSVLLEGDPMGQAPAWLGILVTFTALHWSLGGLLFGRIVEDG